MMTRSRPRAIAAAAALAVVVLTSACNDPKPPSTSSSTTSATTSSSTTASPTSTPTPLTPAEKDIKSAEDTIARFWRVLDRVASDPTVSLSEIATVARGQANSQWLLILSGDRAKQWKQVGSATVEEPSASTKDGKVFTVTACVDVSKVNAVDKTGKSVVKPGRPDRQQYTYTVEKAPQGFFVTVDTLKGKPC